MKHTLLTFFVLICSSVFSSVHAQNTMTFVAGDDVCTPITVTVSGKSYRVSSSLTISQVNGYVKAVDCNGRKLKYDFSKRGSVGNSADTYTFHNTYDVNRDSGYSSSNDNHNNNNYNSNSNSSAYHTGAALGGAIFGLGGGAEGDAYPSWQFAPGISRAYGENIKIRYSGNGFQAYACIGKDWLFDNEFKDKILWNVGIGSYFAFGGGRNPNMDFSLGLSVGQQAQWEKLSLMIDSDYTCWIGRWRRVGVFAGGGIGWGSFTEEFNTKDYESHGGFTWNVDGGIVIRLSNF